MKTNLTHIIVLAAFALASGCKKAPEESASPGGQASQPAASKAEAPDPSLPEKKVEITGNDTMKFDVTTIEAKPGQKVTVTLKNTGTMPKMSMGHNFVLLASDIDVTKFVEAGTPHMGKDYIAPEFADKVIANTKLLGPGESDTVSFAAPRKPGTYTYICSFPGHYAIGMKGTLTVQ
jgi:azurin